jgi:hypothetical protein
MRWEIHLRAAFDTIGATYGGTGAIGTSPGRLLRPEATRGSVVFAFASNDRESPEAA